MNKSLSFIFLSLLVLLSGCSWIGGRRAVDIRPRGDVLRASVQVLDPGAFSAGGKVAFVPFVAGKEAEAGEELDRMSLMMVKGAADAFNSARTPWQIVTGENAEEASYVIDGRVEEYGRTRGEGKIPFLGKKTYTFKIRAEMRRVATGEIVAVIFGYKIFRYHKAGERAAYEIGERIAGELIKQGASQ